MDMELLTNQELSAIKGGEWVELEDGFELYTLLCKQKIL